MQTQNTPRPNDALLAGAILEEYRDLLDSPQMLEAAKKLKKKDETDCGDTPTCLKRPKPKPKPKPKKKALSWIDLPRA